jgi:FtsP/CotA-like multicopper oxidase with cupredoxin domain
VTTFIVRFAPIDGSMAYPFDATEGPGYVWHCHIIDHEDNEMMRPYTFMDMGPMEMETKTA